MKSSKKIQNRTAQEPSRDELTHMGEVSIGTGAIIIIILLVRDTGTMAKVLHVLTSDVPMGARIEEIQAKLARTQVKGSGIFGSRGHPATRTTRSAGEPLHIYQ